MASLSPIPYICKRDSGGTMETMEVTQDWQAMETTEMDWQGGTIETIGVDLWETMEIMVVKIIAHGGTTRADQ